MVGADFITFITLLLTAAVVAIILNTGFNLSNGSGLGAWLEIITVNYVGAWVSPFVIGTGWFGLSYEGVSIIPAIVGAALLHVLYLRAKAAQEGQGSSKSAA